MSLAFSKHHWRDDVPPLVLIHGLLGSQHDWAPLINHAHYPMLTIDLPGHGDSRQTRLRVEDGFNHIYQLLQQTLVQAGVKQYWLVGYSMGGRVVLNQLARGAAGCVGAVIESSHPGLSSEAERAKRLKEDMHWAMRFAHESLEHVLHDWYGQAVFSDLGAKAKATLIGERCCNWGICIANTLSALSLARQSDFNEVLQSSSPPVHYFAPSDDSKYAQIGQQLALSGVNVSKLTGGHNLHRQNVTQFWQQLSALL